MVESGVVPERNHRLIDSGNGGGATKWLCDHLVGENAQSGVRIRSSRRAEWTAQVTGVQELNRITT